MRGLSVGGSHNRLSANSSSQEFSLTAGPHPTSTGFQLHSSSNINTSGSDYIYIAIRRGPLAPPESATEVFDVDFQDAADPSFETNFTVDAGLRLYRPGGTPYLASRLTGTGRLATSSTSSESSSGSYEWDFSEGWGSFGITSTNVVSASWKRAPNFFDVVAYTGNSTAGRTVSHNLGVAPEMMWVKLRDGGLDWAVYHKDLYNGRLWLNDTNAYTGSSMWNNTLADADNFTVGSSSYVNLSNRPFIAYLFASLDGVSKVGSYTGDGTTDGSKVIDCGFTSGARFVLIKRSTAGGSW
jgi:hypothetical protein